MTFVRRASIAVFALLISGLFQGCDTLQSDAQLRRNAMNQQIAQEAPGDYYIGRRFYKEAYKFWGWIRKPGQPWSQSQLVMLNEQKVLAPDRQQGHIGMDNDYEYILKGYFSGDKVYEPASDTVYPEFVLTGYEVRSTTPPLIFFDKRSVDPTVRLLTPPM